MSSPDRAVLILAGGAGTRLWPLSTDDNPKQFLKLFGGQSLLEKTIERLTDVAPLERTFVSTNERYLARVQQLLPQLPSANILVEPARRNTAPAIAVCCATIEAKLGGECVIGVFASDHAIGRPDDFRTTVIRAFEFAASHPTLMTVGIDPTEPNTGFGYLELGDEIAPGVYDLKRFVEKPDSDRAAKFLAAGNFVWNASMFIWRANVFFAALRETAPAIEELSRRFIGAGAEEQRTLYERMPSISIDYALMEKTHSVAAVRGDFDWSDVGSWRAVARAAGDAAATNVHLSNAERVYVNSSSGRPVAVAGLSDVAIIESENGILVLNLKSSESISPLVKEIERRKD
ncbi:MAG TPA: mannose-1-phosphate guanylyltransferase [Thermoanaerobaculia bacterium]|nr:mannose-1-phosphate guanylyltransferase [Thermoanaerobaculia bacterium]